MRQALLTFALLALSCSAPPSGPPEIVVDRSACSHCGMLISETIYAAAYRTPGSDGRVFDDIACMLEAMRRDAIDPKPGTGVRVWFHDANDGTWIEGEGAVFVVSSSIRTPMGGGIIAFRDIAAAEQAAGRNQGQVVRSMPELTKRKGEQR